MIDILAPKVSIPAGLFALLSPGLLLQIPDRLPIKDANALMTMKTSRMSVLVHALVLVVVYWLVARERKIVLAKTDLIIPALLFVLLSPGMLLTLPPGSKGVLMSGQTSVASIAVHMVVFAAVFALLRTTFPKYY